LPLARVLFERGYWRLAQSRNNVPQPVDRWIDFGGVDVRARKQLPVQ
jgi:hypothetical protein